MECTGSGCPPGPRVFSGREVCAFAGMLIFSKEAPHILPGLARNLQRLGGGSGEAGWGSGVPRSLVVGGRPRRSSRSAGDSALAGSSRTLKMHRRRGSWSASIGSWSPTSSRAGPSQITWTSKTSSTVGLRKRRSDRPHGPGVPAERLAQERRLGEVFVETDRRWVLRVAQQPLVRGGPQRLLGRPGLRRQACRGQGVSARGHRGCTGRGRDRCQARVFAGGLTIVDPAHQNQLEVQCQPLPPTPPGRGPAASSCCVRRIGSHEWSYD